MHAHVHVIFLKNKTHQTFACLLPGICARSVTHLSGWHSKASFLYRGCDRAPDVCLSSQRAWCEWRNNRNTGFLMYMPPLSVVTKPARWHKWPVKDGRREKKEKRRHLGELWAATERTRCTQRPAVEQNLLRAACLNSHLYTASNGLFLSPVVFLYCL